jgi:SAM-dependent methyltransferase
VPPTRAELDRIAAVTLAHYDERAEAFWEGTRDHDVRQNIDALLRHLPGPAPATLLDLGCGPGRDLKTFSDLGHVAIGFEGSPRFAAMARAHSGCTVLEGNLLDLSLPTARFDGVFANAVLFHVPSTELPRVLRELHAALKPGGVLFSSKPARRRAGRLARRALRRLARPRWLAWVHERRRLRRTGALLPAVRFAARAAALAGERLEAAVRAGVSGSPHRVRSVHT